MRIWGTSPESIDEAEDRDKWYKILTKLDIKQPPGDMVVSEEQALQIAQKLGYPVMVRPSFVLGGRAMEIVYTCVQLAPLHAPFLVLVDFWDIRTIVCWVLDSAPDAGLDVVNGRTVPRHSVTWTVGSFFCACSLCAPKK